MDKMTRRFLLAIGFVGLLAWPQPLPAQTYVIKNARIVTVSGPVIPAGHILIQDGKIAAVGPNISIPSNAKVVDAKGLTAYPGMIDPHTSIDWKKSGQSLPQRTRLKSAISIRT
jgi:imidazolonepropionase-like amidohydrolase